MTSYCSTESIVYMSDTIYCVYHFIYLHNMLKSHARVLLNPDYFYKSILRKPGWDTDRGTCPRNSLPHFCRLIFFVVSFKWRDQVSTRESRKSRKLSNFVHSQCFFPTEIGNCGQVLILVYMQVNVTLVLEKCKKTGERFSSTVKSPLQGHPRDKEK